MAGWCNGSHADDWQQTNEFLKTCSRICLQFVKQQRLFYTCHQVSAEWENSFIKDSSMLSWSRAHFRHVFITQNFNTIIASYAGLSTALNLNKRKTSVCYISREKNHTACSWWPIIYHPFVVADDHFLHVHFLKFPQIASVCVGSTENKGMNALMANSDCILCAKVPLCPHSFYLK